MRVGVRARRWGALTAEAGGSLFLVLFLFGIFMVILYALFPSGTPLKELIETARDPGEGRGAPLPVEATLATLQRDVRLRRGNSIAWGSASAGLPLFSQDAVQTFDRSGATISFGSRDRLAVGSNSLVVVTRLNPRDEAGARSYRVQVQGELSGSLSAARKLKLELAAAGHLARLDRGSARFKFAPNDDNSTGLSVYCGEVLMIGAGGEIIRVPAHYGVTLRAGVPVGRVHALPPAPLLAGPARAVYRYRTLPPRVRLAWRGPAGEYHLQLAGEPGFRDCLLDERLAASERSTGNLSRGSYYWRVSRVEQGREGPFSEVGRVDLVRQDKAPLLTVAFPADASPGASCILSGAAEPGATVLVNGVPVPSDAAGKFNRELRFDPGVNLIRVEAHDAAGNASYASRIVYGRF